jgi:hypothetical protein
MIVELPPLLDETSGLTQIPEPFVIQAFIAQLAVEAFHEAAVPGPSLYFRFHRLQENPAVSGMAPLRPRVSQWARTGEDWTDDESLAGLWAYAKTAGAEISKLAGFQIRLPQSDLG